MLITETGGFVKNLETGEYDLVFTTEIGSEMLVRNRAKEFATTRNKLVSTKVYDVEDIVVKTRSQRIVFGPWVEV